MSEENYQRILGRIAKHAGVEREEIERRIEAKRAKLSGLISKEGAAQIVAAELGINFDNEKLKINELLPGMRKVSLIAKIINIFPVRTFERNGKENKVANMIVADETSNTRLVLWDTNHIQLLEKGEIGEGSVIEVSNASVREGEVHLGSFSELKISNSVIEEVKIEKNFGYKNIADFKISDGVKTRAFIVQLFEPRFFNVCAECGKKVNVDGDNFICAEHGKTASEKRAVMNAVIDDGTQTIRSVLFHEKLGELGITELENTEEMLKQRAEVLGKEMVFMGAVRNNKFFNNLEFIIDNVKDVDIDELITELEKK
jgi:replication factor A1